MEWLLVLICVFRQPQMKDEGMVVMIVLVMKCGLQGVVVGYLVLIDAELLTEGDGFQVLMDIS